MRHPTQQGVRTGGLRLLPIVAVLAVLAMASFFAGPAAAAGTFVVNTTEDPGQGSCTTNPGGCTLRDAINAANAAVGGTIQFDIPGAAVAPTISIGSPLPPIKTAVTIDGTTQPNTPTDTAGVTILPTWQNAPGVVIELAPGSDASTVHGLAFGGIAGGAGSTAISVESTHDFVTGNWIGVAADSSTLNPGNIGIDVSGSDNRIGGGATGEPNVIAGALSAIVIGTPDGITMPFGNAIQGNIIGLNPDGTPASGGDLGISVADTQGTVVGNSDGPGALGDVQAHPELGNMIADFGTAIHIADGSTGTIAAGNFIGVDRSGASTAPNFNGIVVQGPSSFVSASTNGNQIGPGNVIAHSHDDGVFIDGTLGSANGNRIVANSIFDNNTDGGGFLGIELAQGEGTANNGIAAPLITSVSGATVSGTFSTPTNDPAFIELFINGSCGGQFASGAGEIYTTFVEGTNGKWSTSIGGLKPTDGITATATDEFTNDTSEFSDCSTVGSLFGSVDQSIVKPVDLTAIGTSDWALWGYNSPSTDLPASALTPNETKATGGRKISDLTIVNGDGTAVRGFGSFADNLVPFNFDWTDGAPDAAVSGGHAGITAPKIGQALSFTVPADVTPQKLTIWTSAHFADGTLDAHLSDGSAPDFIQTFHAVAGSGPNSGDNAPATYTLQYHSASAGQQLTVTWKQTANNNCTGCDDIVIYGAALSGNVATGVSASFSSGQTVEMSGTVPISNIPLAAFDPQPPGAPPITTPQGLQLGHTQLGQTQLGHTQLGQTQLGHTQLGQTQLGHTQLGHTQLGHTQLGQTQLGQTQLGQTQLGHTQLGHTQLGQTELTLNTVQLNPIDYPNGWADLLQGTTLADQPLQTITLGDALALTTADVITPPSGMTAQQVIDRIHGLTFADVDLPDSTLGEITMDALTLGPSLINQLGGELQNVIETQLHDWCESIAASGDPYSFCSGDATGDGTTAGGGPGIGYFSLMQLGLLGAPVDTLQLGQTQLGHTQLGQTQLGHTQLGQTQLGHTPLDDLSGSASGIVGMQLGHTDLSPGTGISGLLVSNLPTATQNALFDCSNSANFDCANPTTSTLANAQAAGAIKPGTLVGDLDVGDFFDGVTIEQLLDTIRGLNSAYQDTVTFGDVVGLLMRNTDVSWESLSPDLLTIFDPSRHQLSMTAGFTVHGTGSAPADVKIDLPAGFDFAPGSATLTENGDGGTPLSDPTITAPTTDSYALDWHLDSVDAEQQYTITFGAFAGTTVGPTHAIETVSADGHSRSSVASFSVTDSFPGSGSAPDATPIDTTPAHETVDMSTVPTAGAVDYYTFPMPAVGTRIQVHLTDLPADYDLALYAPRTTSVRTTSNLAPPLQDGVVPDTQVNLIGGSSGQLTPTGLEDVPDPGIPLVQLSDNRHQDDEDVGMVSPGGGGQVTIAVFGYNGAFSPDAYTLRVRESAPPPTETCSARVLPDHGQGTTPDSLPTTSSLPSNLNTIILVNEKRLGDTYGSADEATAVAKLNHLATGDASLGVSGVVVPVEKIAGAQDLYDTWDSNPCDPSSANAVANAIADEVDAIVAARPNVKYVVFGGGDDQIPFFRLPDLSLLANESGFTGLGTNEYGGSLAAGDLLSDDPYLDTQPVPASGQQLFPPNLAGGRLVETAQDIANAITNFETAPTPGALKSSTGFVSGYDFVADGSQSVANNLTANGVNVHTLDNPLSPTSNWGSAAFLAAAFPTVGPADINSWNGHYDNYRAQMANGDIVSTSDLPSGLNGGIFFTMGCHAGFQTTDAVVGSTVLDWPQYFAQHDTGFVGNTGFGLGETDSVAFSEELMADFAGQLKGTSTLGNALMQAKQQYYLSRVAFSNYDEKALSEAELYGLPMFGIDHSPTSLAAPNGSQPDPVNGSNASASPSQGPLSSFPGSGVQSANFAATPNFGLMHHGTNGDFFTNAGQVQAPNYRPLQPYVSLPAARSGLVAHGVVVDTLTSSDNSGFTPDNVRPILNSSADEPPPTFTDEAWPEKIPTLVSLGSNQSLNLITGQFFTESSGIPTTGVERLWTQIGGRVTYSNSQDFTPPTIDSIHAFQSNGVVAFSGQFSDLDQNGNPGTVSFAEVVYDDGLGHWTALPLQHDSTSGLWSGAAPFTGAHIQYFVEVCDAAGNCGYSSNKGRYFDAQPLPSGTGGGSLTIDPSRHPDTSGTWYTHGLSVTATSNAPTVSVSVDGSPFQAGPAAVSGDGAHVVDARDSDGNTATAVYLVDSTGPAITHTITPAMPNGTSGWYTSNPTVKFFCADNVSGAASCPGQTVLQDSQTPQTVSGTAFDNAGNQSHDSVLGIQVDTTPPATPVFTGISPQIYPVNSLPAQSAIGCMSNDGTSGLKNCIVTGYSNAVGAHTLTATATDNAGNTNTATLTYTVGFQAGNILAPVTAPTGDQTNPTAIDLQVFKIKSTVPLKFQFYLDSARTTLMTTPPAGSIAYLTVAKLNTSTNSTDQTDLVTSAADTGNQFRWSGGQYVYNMATSQLTPGTYYCQITLKAAEGTVLGQSLKQYFVLRS
jgi:CSLREA domain-containing protein